MPVAVARQTKNCSMADHTPDAAVAVGEVVVVENHPKVCHRPIPANEKGALSEQGGVYRMVAGASVDDGEDVYFNVAAGKVNKLASATAGDKHFGRATNGTSAAADGAEIDVLHTPNGTAKE